MRGGRRDACAAVGLRRTSPARGGCVGESERGAGRRFWGWCGMRVSGTFGASARTWMKGGGSGAGTTSFETAGRIGGAGGAVRDGGGRRWKRFSGRFGMMRMARGGDVAGGGAMFSLRREARLRNSRGVSAGPGWRGPALELPGCRRGGGQKNGGRVDGGLRGPAADGRCVTCRTACVGLRCFSFGAGPRLRSCRGAGAAENKKTEAAQMRPPWSGGG